MHVRPLVDITASSAESPRIGHAFLSYVRDDSVLATRLYDELSQAGVIVWMDRTHLAPGVRWRQAIRNAIRDGAYFVACFSAAFASRSKAYMYEELLLAVDELRQRPIDRTWFIPIKLSPCEIPELEVSPTASLRDFQVVDLYDDWDGSVRRIVEVIAPFPRALKKMIEQLRSPIRDVRARAAEALFDRPDPRALYPLIKALDDREEPLVGYWASQALGRIRDPKAVPALIRTLKTCPTYTYKFAEVLAYFNTTDAIEVTREYELVRDNIMALVHWQLGDAPERALARSLPPPAAKTSAAARSRKKSSKGSSEPS